LDPEWEYDRIELVTDAAVHVHRKKSAIAWQILGPEPDLKKSRNAMSLQMKDVSYSYREELLGIYHGLQDTISRFKRVIALTCHCDCEAAIEKIKQPAVCPGQFLSADMEIVMAIKTLVETTDIRISFNHIEGHPEKRKRKEDFTYIELANYECDRDAELCVENDTEQLQYTPLKGSLCVIRIGKEWLSNRPDYPIQQAFVVPELKEYISQRLKIPIEVVETIDTESIGTVRALQQWQLFARSSKLLHNWLPVGHNWKRYADMDTDKCPCCGMPDETFHHLLECPNELMVQLRTEQLSIVKKTALEQGLPPTVMHHVLNILKNACNEGNYNLPTQLSIKRAWEGQERIGFKNMAIGWMCNEWTKAFQVAGSEDPEGCSVQLLTLIWQGLCEPIWTLRNDILHRNPNPRVLTEMKSLADQLQWYWTHKRSVLAPPHYILAEYTSDDVKRWNRMQPLTHPNAIIITCYSIKRSRQEMRDQR
jgi:hypothetical protein